MLGIKFNTLFATPKSYSWIDQIFRVKSKFWLWMQECRSQFKRAEPIIFRTKLSSCKRNRRTKKRGSACRNLSVPYPKWLSCKRGFLQVKNCNSVVNRSTGKPNYKQVHLLSASEIHSPVLQCFWQIKLSLHISIFFSSTVFRRLEMCSSILSADTY
jgi:hypothetical protein